MRRAEEDASEDSGRLYSFRDASNHEKSILALSSIDRHSKLSRLCFPFRARLNSRGLARRRSSRLHAARKKDHRCCTLTGWN